MTSAIHSITFDADDAYALSLFWAQVLDGYAEDPEDPNFPDDPMAMLKGPAGEPNLLFIPVPEGKTAKNRVHLDLQPTIPREEEVYRLLRLGATLVDDRREVDGTGWAVMADPEGNEFCVERSKAERG
jgi:predicted enzyme related to lactoylglutathione lyase